MQMGLRFSCPGTGYDSWDESLDALLKSLNLSNDYIKSSLRSVSFNGRASELRSWGSGKLIIKGSLSFNKRDKEPCGGADKKFSKKSPISPKETPQKAATFKNTRFAPPEKINEPGSPKHEAAVKLQKVYKSFRTRRQLADCAVLVEQRWWKLLDFAMLRRSSVSFFDIEKTESAVSKWSRAKSRAAKVGKGLSKDKKARKLALQHWLEAIDPRHRYGHNLHFYYDGWLRCESKQPFFYWLDVGEGKEVSDEKCPRSKLQQQCIKYLGPKEREDYEIIIEDGKLMYKKSGELLDTTGDHSESKWIFVLSTSKNLYVSQKKKGIFQHSSFLAGGATSAAGRLEVEKGTLKAIWPHSGHYRPTEENFQEFCAYLESRNVDLTDVQKVPVEGEEETYSIPVLRPSRSQVDLCRKKTEELEVHPSNVTGGLTIRTRKRSKSFDTSADSSKAESEEEEERARKKKMMTDDSEESEEEKAEIDGHTDDVHSAGSEPGENGKVMASSTSKGNYRFRKPNLFVGEHEGVEEATVPSELILRRMNFGKGNLSLQLGNKLTCKWTTGAGPRIGCVRDFPSELRFRALEQVCLSPMSDPERAWTSSGNLPSPIPRASAVGSVRKAQETSTLKEINKTESDR